MIKCVAQCKCSQSLEKGRKYFLGRSYGGCVCALKSHEWIHCNRRHMSQGAGVLEQSQSEAWDGDKPLKGVDHGAVKQQVAEVDPGHSRQASERPSRP